MKLAVTGGRTYHDRRAVFIALNRVHREHTIELLMQGGALGADALAKEWAEANGVPVVTYHANWVVGRKGAGHSRNAVMLKYGQPDWLLAFPGGPGTANCVAEAERLEISVISVLDAGRWPEPKDLGAGI